MTQGDGNSYIEFVGRQGRNKTTLGIDDRIINYQNES
jgi:hypothetical protein